MDQIEDPELPDEADLRVVLRLCNRDLGTGSERQAIEALGERLDAALTAADAGEFEGEEIGGGQCILFFRTLDRELTMATVRAVVAGSSLARDAHFEFAVERPDGTVQRRHLPL